MLDKHATDGAMLRRQLGASLASDSDFNAFCIDYFPNIFRRFSDNMDRVSKENILLIHAEPTEIRERLHYLAAGIDRLSTLPTSATDDATDAVQPPRAPYDRRWYVPRVREERRARDALRYSQPIVLHGPELYGKTWLLQAILSEPRSQGTQVAEINLSLFDRAARDNIDSFLAKLAMRMCKELDLPVNEAERIFIEQRQRGGPLEAINDLLEYHILPRIPGSIILALDNVDLIAGRPYQDEFFSLLRAWADTTGGEIRRLQLALSISTAPVLLVQDIHCSPFNVGDQLVLADLPREQIELLARQHGLSPPPSDFERMAGLVGGHPYLTRIALYGAWATQRSLSDVLTEVDQDGRGGVFAEYLSHVHRRLEARPLLLATLRQVAAGEGARLDTQSCRLLERAGLIYLDSQRTYRLRHQLYQRLI